MAEPAPDGCLPAAFPTSEGVVYLRPAASPALALAHWLLHERLGAHGELVHAYYRPGAWQPHCTMAINVAPALGDAVMAACRAPEVLGTVHVASLQVVRYRPATELARVPFT